MPRAFSNAGASRCRARRILPGAIALLAFGSLLCGPLAASAQENTASLLQRAELVKSADYTEFQSILKELEARTDSLSESEKQHVLYYRAWQVAYEGDYTSAIPTLESLTTAGDKVLALRARAMLVNVLSIAKHFDQAFTHMRPMLDLIPEVDDSQAREQALGVAALLYNHVGQYDSGLQYAGMLAARPVSDQGFCKAEELRLEALYRSGRIKTVDLEFQRGIDACVKSGELVFANLIRSFVARLHIEQKRYDEALKLLLKHYEEARATHYARLISEFDALLATAYRETGDSAQARVYALRTIEDAIANQYTEPLVVAYRLLYVLGQGTRRDPRCAHVSREIRCGGQGLSRRRERTTTRLSARESRRRRRQAAHRHAQQGERGAAAATRAGQESRGNERPLHHDSDSSCCCPSPFRRTGRSVRSCTSCACRNSMA